MTIIVPYRDRADHLAQFIPHMRAFCPDARILVMEQTPGKPFNRGMLLNIGVQICPDDYYAFHDVDKLPVKGNYSYPQRPRQIAPNEHQQKDYLGGVTLFNWKDIWHVGGYSNNFWGWGGEDNELHFRCRFFGLKIEYDFGEFIDLPHPRPTVEFDEQKWRQAKRRRQMGDLLGYAKYSFVSSDYYDTHSHIIVEI